MNNIVCYCRKKHNNLFLSSSSTLSRCILLLSCIFEGDFVICNLKVTPSSLHVTIENSLMKRNLPGVNVFNLNEFFLLSKGADTKGLFHEIKLNPRIYCLEDHWKPSTDFPCHIDVISIDLYTWGFKKSFNTYWFCIIR